MKRLHQSRGGNRHQVLRAIGPAIEALEQRVLLSFSAVPTYESVGLYWSPGGGSGSVQATVKYRVAGATTWKNAQDLWFAPAENGRPAEYRGSILGLTAATTYDVEVDMAGAAPPEDYQFTTRNDNFPIAQTIVVANSSTPLEINNVHGTDNGYILYTGPATIDVANAAAYDIRIQNSDHVIIRGLTLKGATGDGILLGPSTSANSDNVHDIVIENNDISGWGSVIIDSKLTATQQQTIITNNWGWDDQAGIRSNSTNLELITIQRNKIHDPRTDANSWKETNPEYNTTHPEGPQGITLENGTKGGMVVRYNEITGDNNHRFNDGMGADQNFTYGGFPARDSDIYGNVVMYTWDDGYEIEGANMNVRVFNNYADQTYTGVAMAATTMGPLYIVRNVFGHSQTSSISGYTSYGGTAFKRQGGSSPYASDGRIYIYNNTLYNQATPMFQGGLTQSGSGPYALNTISRNNILRVRSSTDNSVQDPLTDSSGSSYDYDLYNGKVNTPNYVTPQESHGILGTPTYVSGSGYNAATGQGIFQLASTSLGYDKGVFLANITDGYSGVAPDIGAHEAGAAAMQFGVNANIIGARWIGAAGDGNWSNPLNWSNGDVPDTATEYARIDTNTPSTVNLTLASGTMTIAGLYVTSGNTLALKRAAGDSTGTLRVAALNNAGTITLNHYGSANRSVVRLTVTKSGQTFNIGTITATTNVSRVGESAGLTVPAMSRNDGTINLNNSTGGTGSSNFGWLYVSGSGTLTNNGTINLSYTGSNTSDARNTLYLNTANAQVTLGGTGSLIMSTNGTASRAQITGAGGASLINAATHSIKGAGLIGNNTLASFTNLGLVNATGGAQIVVDLASGAINNAVGGRFIASGIGGMAVGAAGDSFTNNGLFETDANSPLSAGSNLLLSSTATVNFQLGSTAKTVAVTGGMTLDGTLNVTALTGFAAGTYRLFTCAPGQLINNGLNLGTLPGGFTYSLSVNTVNGTVDLIVS